MFAQNNNYVIILGQTDTIPENNMSGYVGTHIIFPCNKTYFDKKQDSWIELNNTITDILNDSTLTLEEIHMYGAASPEGPYNNNVYLSINRAKRVIDALKYNFPKVEFNTKIKSYNVPEDYDRLIYVTKDDSLYQDISKYITDDDFETKRQLQADTHRWKDLLKRYYPGLRAVNILIYVRKTEIGKIVVVPILPEIKFPEIKPELKIDTISLKPIVSENLFCFKQPMVRIKTNLLYDLCVVPNWSIEFLPKTGHITPEFKMMWAGWRNDNNFKTWIIHAFEVGGRYYFKDNVHTGFFLNCSAGVGVYDIQTSKNHASLSKKYLYNNKFELGCGFVQTLKNNWTIEYTLGLGCIYSKFDKYHGAESWATNGEFYYNWHLQPENFRRYNNRFIWLGPVNIGISISYDILHYRKTCEKRSYIQY